MICFHYLFKGKIGIYQYGFKQSSNILSSTQTSAQENISEGDFSIFYSLTFLYKGRVHLPEGKEKLEPFLSLSYPVDEYDISTFVNVPYLTKIGG